jgi:hypothetical protein
MKKFKQQYFACQPGPKCGYFEKNSIFVLSGLFWGFLWLSLALKNLVKLSNTGLDHWNNKNQFSC